MKAHHWHIQASVHKITMIFLSTNHTKRSNKAKLNLRHKVFWTNQTISPIVRNIHLTFPIRQIVHLLMTSYFFWASCNGLQRSENRNEIQRIYRNRFAITKCACVGRLFLDFVLAECGVDSLLSCTWIIAGTLRRKILIQN